MHRPLLPVAAFALTLAALIAQAPVAGQSTDPDNQAEQMNAEEKARVDRRDAEQAAAQAAHSEAQRRYEADVRAAAASRAEYEAAMARHQAELERSQREQAEYQRRIDAYNAEHGGRSRDNGRDAGGASSSAPAADTSASSRTASATTDCQRQNRRNRRRGRVLGGIIGSVAGGAVGDSVGGAIAALPIGALIGDVIARQLNCDEQDQAADATERAVAGGVGTTAEWTSETREGVTGSTTVVATEAGADGSECLTVTDVVIVDGEETRAPKRMCRRPPSNRFVRV